MAQEPLSFRRDLRANLTTPERILWSRLRKRKIDGFRFRRQHPVGPYVVDFFCHERQLAIEVDGDSHYFARGIASDRRRHDYLTERGIRTLRFTNTEIAEELDGVLESIRGALKD